MCGFTGFVDRNGIHSEHLQGIEQASHRLTHRGPDAHGLFTNAYLAVAHRRLSIIDVADRANQPMVSSCKRYLLVYNGEVYNYRELRQTLVQRRHSFTTESDTEVVLHHLMEFGEAGISALNGCFALAFIDLHEPSVLLVRDRFGINPLWYARQADHQLAFASEGKALVGTENMPIRSDAVKDILTFSYNPEHASIRSGVFRLPPGSYLKWPGPAEPVKWFSPAAEQASNTTASLRDAIENAVVSRLIADVPVGCFLSGGIDSSIVSAIAARHHSQLATFSVGFNAFAAYDESAAAHTVATHIGSEHHCFQMEMDDLERHAHTVLEHCDEPFADSSAIAASFLAENTAKFVKVALSGDGADELLGGYRKHRAHAFYANASALGRTLRVALLKQLAAVTTGKRSAQLGKLASVGRLSPADRYFALARFAQPNEVEALFPHASAEGENQKSVRELFRRYPEMDAVLYADQLLVLPNDMLTKVDLTSMRHSLEVRVPFLDPAVIAALQAIPVKARYSSKTGKMPLRTAFADLLPQSVFQRKKQGFEVPLAELLRTRMHGTVAQLKTSNRLKALGFDMDGIARLIKRFNEGSNDLAPLVWSLLQVEAWMSRQSNGIQ